MPGVAYGPVSYHAPGRVYPRDSLRDPPPRADRGKARARGLVVVAQSPTTPTIVPLSLEESLVAGLLAQSAITSIIGTRVYPEQCPQKGARPCLVYVLTNEPREYALDGMTIYRRASVTIDAESFSRAEADALAEAVAAYMHGPGTFPGPMGGASGVIINEVSLNDETNADYSGNDGRDRPLRVTSQDYSLRYRKRS